MSSCLVADPSYLGPQGHTSDSTSPGSSSSGAPTTATTVTTHEVATEDASGTTPTTGNSADTTDTTTDTTGTTGTTGTTRGTDPSTTETGSDPGHRMFVTSATYAGDFIELSIADGQCQMLADAAMLGGSWVAVVSVTGESASARIEILGPIENLMGEPVAQSELDLWDGLLDNPIRYDENLAVIEDNVWTGTEIDGTDSPADCMNWQGIANGAVGFSGASDGAWILSGYEGCGTLLHFYCISQ